MSTLRYGLLALGSTLALTACNKNANDASSASSAAATPAAGENVIKIGLAGPLTGPIAHIGKDNEYGVKLAIDEINAAGGLTLGGKTFQLAMVSEDDQADPKTATTVAQRLVDQKVAGVIGHVTSPSTIPASKIYSEAGIPQISPSSTAVKYTDQGFKTAFRMIGNDAQQGKVLGGYVTEVLKLKRVAIIDDRTAYGQGLAGFISR